MPRGEVAALDGMLSVLTSSDDRTRSFAKLIDMTSGTSSSPKPVRSPLKRASHSQRRAELARLAREVAVPADLYENAFWRPKTPAPPPPSSAELDAADKELLLEALRSLSSSVEPPREPRPERLWHPGDTHKLCDSIFSTSLHSSLARPPREPRLFRSPPKREAAAISLHGWSGWSREQSVEATTMMHSPGHLRGYSRELSAAPHRHRDYEATPYRKVQNMYPGGLHPETDPQAINFMKGYGTMRTSAPRSLSRIKESKSSPRLCTSYTSM